MIMSNLTSEVEYPPPCFFSSQAASPPSSLPRDVRSKPFISFSKTKLVLLL